MRMTSETLSCVVKLMTAEQEKMTRTLYEQGMSDYRISRMIHKNIEAVRKWRIINGLQPNATCVHKVRKPIPRDEVKDLYESGWSGIQIADKFGVASSTVYIMLQSMDYAGMKQKRLEERHRNMERLKRYRIKKGLSQAQLSKKFGYSSHACYAWETGAAAVPKFILDVVEQYEKSLDKGVTKD